MGIKERFAEARKRSAKRGLERKRSRAEQIKFNKKLAEELKEARRETYREEAIRQARLEGARVAERRGTRKERFKAFAKKTGMSIIKKPTAVRRAPIRRVKKRTAVKYVYRRAPVKRRKTIVRRAPVKRRVVRQAPAQQERPFSISDYV